MAEVAEVAVVDTTLTQAVVAPKVVLEACLAGLAVF